MRVLVTSNFNDDSIKNGQASVETSFSHYKSMGYFFCHSGAANCVFDGPMWPKFEFIQDIMHILVTCKIEKDWIDSNREKVETSMFLTLKGSSLCSQWSYLAKILTHPIFHACSCYLQVS